MFQPYIAQDEKQFHEIREWIKHQTYTKTYSPFSTVYFILLFCFAQFQTHL